MKRTWFMLTCLCLFAGLIGCDGKDDEMEVMTMRKQARYDTQTTSTFFADGMTARPAVEHAVTTDAGPTTRPAMSVALLERGQERFGIYCAMCHGANGAGHGMVVQRGFPPPPTFHSDRLRGLPDDYLNGVITHGLGKMPPYADQIPPDDRWAIVAYVRALQRSQHANLQDVPAESQHELTAPVQGATAK